MMNLQDLVQRKELLCVCVRTYMHVMIITQSSYTATVAAVVAAVVAAAVNKWRLLFL